jgi:hypothetical protein
VFFLFGLAKSYPRAPSGRSQPKGVFSRSVVESALLR